MTAPPRGQGAQKLMDVFTVVVLEALETPDYTSEQGVLFAG